MREISVALAESLPTGHISRRLNTLLREMTQANRAAHWQYHVATPARG